MNGRARVLLLLFAVFALLLAGCTYVINDAGVSRVVQDPAQSDAINIATEVGLIGTTEIHVFQQSDTTPDLEVYLGTITEPNVIESIVGALDMDRPLVAEQACAQGYRLQFRLADGSAADFGFACQLATPSYLGGEQTFWHDRVVIAPDRFNELMAEQLATMPSLDASRLHFLLPPG